MAVSSISFKYTLERPKSSSEAAAHPQGAVSEAGRLAALNVSRLGEDHYLLCDHRQYILQSLWYGYSPQCAYRVAGGYAGQILLPNTERMAWTVLESLNSYERRVRKFTPLKARSRQRLLVGVREILRAMRPAPGVERGRVKALVVAVDVDEAIRAGEEWAETMHLAQTQAIPIVFALSKGELANVLGRSGRVTSMVGLVSFEGCHQLVVGLCEAARGAADLWEAAAQDLLVEALKSGRGDLMILMAAFGHLSVLQSVQRTDAALLARNINFVESSRGETALIGATRHSHQSVVQLLLAMGASPTVRDFTGRMPLDYAAENGSLGIFALLWSSMGEELCEDLVLRPPLDQHENVWATAVRRGHAPLAKFIIDHMSRLSVKVCHILYAVEHNQPTIFLQLLPLWHEPTDAELGQMLCAMAHTGNTNFWNGLHHKWILGKWGRTPGQIPALLDQPDAAERTPAWIAASLGHAAMAGRFLALGADPHNRCRGGAKSVLELLGRSK